jgi:hypothetical protein
MLRRSREGSNGEMERSLLLRRLLTEEISLEANGLRGNGNQNDICLVEGQQLTERYSRSLERESTKL